MNCKDLLELYFKDLNPDEPFKNSGEEKAVFCRFLDLLLVLSIYQSENAPEEAMDRVGVLLPDAELMRSFEPSVKRAFSDFALVRQVYLNILLKLKNTAGANDFATLNGLPITAIITSGLLSDLQALAFIMALSTSLNRKYEKLYAILSQFSGDSMRPTIGLCLDLARFFLEEDERDKAFLFEADSFLNKVLIMPFDSQIVPELSRPLVLRKQALIFLEDLENDLGDIELCAEYLTPVLSEVNVHEKEEDELFNIYSNGIISETASNIILIGETGSGKRFLVERLLDRINKVALAIDISKLISIPEARREEILSDICVKAVLFNNLIYVHKIPEARFLTGDFLYILSFLQSYFDTIIIGSEGNPSKELFDSLKGDVYQIKLPEISISKQKLLWQQVLKDVADTVESDVNLDEIVSKYTLNPGRIIKSVNEAFCLSDDGIITKKVLEDTIRLICSVSFGENAKKIVSPFTWDDLIIDEGSKELLMLACNRVKCKSIVNDEFGFGKKLPYGRGIAIALYGPPGTGKTMAAQVLANELSLDLYRIDLSQISSKYIGETEKNLCLLFNAAKNSNAILFFDEADSLFSKRTNVSSSNDKYANAETSYLLQKIEEYSGLSILATNNLQNFDVAFKRRMTYIIPVGLPDGATREALWIAAFPPEAPLSVDVDFKVLSQVLEISGSSIKTSAIEAAYRAAAENRSITMNDILDAVDLECMKTGKIGAKNDVLSKML